jgi:hypothetical protein
MAAVLALSACGGNIPTQYHPRTTANLFGSLPAANIFGVPPIADLVATPGGAAGACQVPWKTPDQPEAKQSGNTVPLLNLVRANLITDDPATKAVMEPVLNPLFDALAGRLGDSRDEADDIGVKQFQNFARNLHGQLQFTAGRLFVARQAPEVSTGLSSANLERLALFEDALGYYFTQLFRGQYVDRFGNTLPAPAISRTIGDSEIAATLSVLVDTIIDFSVRSPVWSYGKNPPIYYPAAYASASTTGAVATKSPVPTAVAFMNDTTMMNHYKDDPQFRKWVVLKKLTTDPKNPNPCGVDALKFQIIEYVSQLAGQKADGITGLALGNFGGFGFSLGYFGKVSVGDNQTLQVMARTLIARVAERIAAELAYRAVYQLDDTNLRFSDILGKVTTVLNTPATVGPAAAKP